MWYINLCFKYLPLKCIQKLLFSGWHNLKPRLFKPFSMAKCSLSRPVSSIGRTLNCESGDPGSIPRRRRSLSLWLITISFLRSFALYLCSGIYRSFSSLRKCRQLVLVNCLTACPGMMRWLNCALVNSMWLTVVIRSENYQQQHHQNAVSRYCVFVQRRMRMREMKHPLLWKIVL
jgi:hypothetical protein